MGPSFLFLLGTKGPKANVKWIKNHGRCAHSKRGVRTLPVPSHSDWNHHIVLESHHFYSLTWPSYLHALFEITLVNLLSFTCHWNAGCWLHLVSTHCAASGVLHIRTVWIHGQLLLWKYGLPHFCFIWVATSSGLGTRSQYHPLNVLHIYSSSL